MSKRGEYEIPFDKDGNQLHHPESRGANGCAWRPNEVFEDTLTYQGYRRGRSAAYFEFARKSGAKVTMFLKDFESAIPKMVRGKIAGRWTFCKRGANYGVQLANVVR